MSNTTGFTGSTHPSAPAYAVPVVARPGGHRRRSRFMALAFILCGLGLNLTACSGKLFFNSPCADVNCPAGTVCDNGTCVSDGVATCNPLNLNGACGTQQSCVSGICYNTQVLPAVCSATVNGTCANNGSCQQGECVPIDASNACSLDLPQGFCPGGQACVFGYCYVDDGALLCSPKNVQGACSVGESCVAGTCQPFVGTCGPTNIDGTCGTWQVCSEGASESLGVCVGPFPPDGCSSLTPNGRCPAEEVCVAGTCTPITTTNVCNPLNQLGLCSSQAVCGDGGHCVVLDQNVACSPTHLTGPCSGGGICRNGVCQQPACSASGGYACPAGQWCAAGTCLPLPCDPVHPAGACTDSTLACVDGICAPPTCSAENPYGVCSQGLVCFAGQCLLPACSSASPSGPCPDPVNQLCQNGVCVVGPCSPTRPNGVCTSRVCTEDPSFGCVLTMPAVCCDSTLQAASACAFGSCATPLCSGANPNGYCPQGQLCVAGACQDAACGPFFLSGKCSNPNANCSQGRCTLLNCTSHGSTQAQRDAYCAPDVCDSNNTGNCVTPACSPTYPTGKCPTGQACCNALAQNANNAATFDANCITVGVCDAPTCSLKYPGGGCPAGKLCASGVCQTPPCSTTYPNGTCGPNYKCQSGSCVQQACSTTYPGGTCPSGQRCTNGSCAAYTCSTTFPQAPCADGNKICQAGSCVRPNCSLQYPGGACPSPQICSNGSCIVPPCSAAVQTGTCPAHELCCNSTAKASVYACTTSLYGKCVEKNCDANNPGGSCSDANLVCFTSSSGTTSCQAYACSANFPQGPCAATGTTCINGSCQQPNCDATHPGGKCAAGYLCNNGTCVQPACSSSNPNGICPSSQNCNATTHRCTLSPCSPTAPGGSCANGKACCNSSIVGAPGCSGSSNYGTCVTTACSTQFPYGSCANTNTICVNSQCLAPCGPNQPRGWCPGGFACVERACAAACANDQDCDNISDADEGLSSLVDTDGDGVPDAYDHDSDGDTIPDSVEAGDTNLSTPPVDTNGDGIPNFRSLDSDGDFLPDSYEAGPAPGVPRDTDSDGKPDYVDVDSDGDGILDRCEAIDIAGQGICANRTLLTPGRVLDTDRDGIPDYRDKDSDGDGVSDHIEARAKPADDGTFTNLGVDHDGDGVPDYRDLDSDGDGVLDKDEDVNGDGIVNCQVDGGGATVADSRTSPTCGQTSAPFSSSVPYDYNPGCKANGQKCLLSESSRVVADTDGNGIGDGADGIYLVCSASNTKPVNLFYSQAADYAYALETSYSKVRTLKQSNVDAGLAFDDNNTSNGSFAVSGMLLRKVPDPNAMAATSNDPNQVLIQKALAQAAIDQASLAADGNVSSLALVINRNFRSFDGYGAVISRFTVGMTNTIPTAAARDILMRALNRNLDTFAATSTGPSSNNFTLTMQTLYRYDNGSTGTVLLAAAVAPTGTDQNAGNSYSYRTLCPAQSTSTACGARTGCAWNGSACVQTSYQLPLFYADNITNGSALTQYGDDLLSTCQSMIQKNPLVDFLWTVDNSASMTPKIGRVANASALFFPLLNTTEADYRVTETSTAASVTNKFPPTFTLRLSNCTNQDGNQTRCTTNGCSYNGSFPVGSRCYWNGCESVGSSTACNNMGCLWTNNSCHFSGFPDRVDGALSHDFTGAIGGITNLSSIDRTVNYACSETCTSPSGTSNIACGFNGYQSAGACPTSLGCAWNGSACVMNCCPTCLGNSSAVPNDPACYFAARLPNDTGSGLEYGLLMTEWALFRGGAQAGCNVQSTQSTCLAQPGCIWSNNTCSQGYCAWSVNPNDPSNHNAQTLCNGSSPTAPPPTVPFTPPYPGQDLMPANCEWDPLAGSSGACTPSVGARCASFSQNNSAYGSVAQAQAACNAAAPRCTWTGSVCEPTPVAGLVLCSGTTASTCIAQNAGYCQWDTCNYANSPACGAVAGCSWNGSRCLPVANGGACRPPLKRMLRANATTVSLLVSDEEECYIKDGSGSSQKNSNGNNVAYDGDCAGGYFTGGLLAYNDPVRVARTASYSQYMRARDVLTFTLTGDKASTALPPPGAASSSNGYGGAPSTLTNGGCYNPAGSPSPYYAEPGQSYINVAESTGGGWGSICAANLYPSIEAMVTSSLGKASQYNLSGFINGHTVQPVASTIKVAVQTCIRPAEYPNCASGTVVSVVPRSRDNGFDYDSINNSLVLYGSARPVVQGSITVSYRYWDNNLQPPAGTSGGCPCPEANMPSCACPVGEVCGKVGNTDNCAGKSQLVCGAAPGCVWNSANNGFCAVTGLCEPDPTCGGPCGAGLVCDPTLGQCVCDPSCGNVCTAGAKCDNNSNVHSCQDKTTSSTCTAVSGCNWNSNTQQCVSTTCGMCLCDTTCGGGCPAGATCDTRTSSPTCGQCACDTTCGGGCPNNQICNTDPNTATCGLCEPPTCGHCPSGFTCNAALQICVCDQSCGGGSCASGSVCDNSSVSATCGQCICDQTCGGGCPAGQTCNTDTTSASCGFCQLDTTCGGCNPPCNSSTASACNASNGCRWAPWLNNGSGSCTQVACRTCDSSTGLCHADTACCGHCGPNETCNSTTGQCSCDTTCGGCPAGQVCNTNTADVANCGACQCDTTCGATCPQGEVCDGNVGSGTCGFCVPDPTCGVGGQCNPACTATNPTTCANTTGCQWEAWANGGNGACGPIACKICNQASGVCTTDTSCCGACGPGQKCNPSTGSCVCDTSCGGGCTTAGQICNSNLSDGTCGLCVCDTTCGGRCPTGQVCDTNTASGTCGACIIDTTCGGNCPYPLVCNSTTGLCGPDPHCGGCAGNYTCNITTGQCVPPGG